MREFWHIFINLIRQYTIADTAYLFSIVEGLATVVAAIGAIIAVVVTKQIAKKQVTLANQQNKISDKQADIALLQSNIMLLERRVDAIKYIQKLFIDVYDVTEMLLHKESIDYGALFRSYVISREDEIIHPSNSHEYTSRVLLQYNTKRGTIDILFLEQLSLIFTFDFQDAQFVICFTDTYKQFHAALRKRFENTKDDALSLDLLVQINGLTSPTNREKFLQVLMEQARVIKVQ